MEDEQRMRHKRCRREQKSKWKQRKKEQTKKARIEDQQKRRAQKQQQAVSVGVQAGYGIVSGTQTSTGTTADKQEKSMPIKEINSLHVVKSNKHLGSGSFGSCFLAHYRGLLVVVKELHLSAKQPEEEARRMVQQEARIIQSLDDHPNLPLLYGICSTKIPFRLIMQFHGDKNSSLTLRKAVHGNVIQKAECGDILKQIAKALLHIHSQGYLHNDLKSNNLEDIITTL